MLCSYQFAYLAQARKEENKHQKLKTDNNKTHSYNNA